MGLEGERRGMEKLEERYLRWEARTPGYLIREKLQRKKLKSRAERRAWSFEKRLDERKGS